MTVLGIDVSHHQEDAGKVNFGSVRAAGYRFAILKATEGSTYVDPAYAAMRTRARAAGLVTGAYHFARAGNVYAEVDRFCRTVGDLAVGELVVLDWEVAAANTVNWCLTWLREVRDLLGVKPLIYMNQSVRDSFDWSPVVKGDFGLWLAKYDFNQTQPASGQWPLVAMKQFTDKGIVPGVVGGVDVDVFYGDMTTLARYGKAAPPAPTPTPAPEPGPVEDDAMKFAAYRTPDLRVWLAGPGIWWLVPSDAYLGHFTTKNQINSNGVVDVTQGQADLFKQVWLSGQTAPTV